MTFSENYKNILTLVFGKNDGNIKCNIKYLKKQEL